MHSNVDSLKGFLAHVMGAVAIMKQYDLAGRDADTLTKAIHMRQKWAAVSRYTENPFEHCLIFSGVFCTEQYVRIGDRAGMSASKAR